MVSRNVFRVCELSASSMWPSVALCYVNLIKPTNPVMAAKSVVALISAMAELALSHPPTLQKHSLRQYIYSITGHGDTWVTGH